MGQYAIFYNLNCSSLFIYYLDDICASPVIIILSSKLYASKLSPSLVWSGKILICNLQVNMIYRKMFFVICEPLIDRLIKYIKATPSLIYSLCSFFI